MTVSADQPGRPLLVTIDEAADLLGVGRTIVYELLAEGEFVSVQIHRCRRIAVADLEAYIARLRGGSAAETAYPLERRAGVCELACERTPTDRAR